MDYEQLLALSDRIGFVKPVHEAASDTEINRLPTSTFKKKPASSASSSSGAAGGEAKAAPAGGSSDSANKSCCICLSDFEDGDSVRSLPCLHMFHTEEIDHWLRSNNTCPVCRVPIT